MTFGVHPIDILHVNDNYVWAITPNAEDQTYVVDPGAAQPVLDWLRDRSQKLAGILITHHHWDHVNGVDGLLEHASVPVWGPAASIPQITHTLGEGDMILLDDAEFQVMEVPGHTRDHIAYFSRANPKPALFCGDTLFACGCGRIFDGTIDDLHLSLSRLTQFPADTQVYCAHEYTLANLQFAQAVEPENADIRERLKAVRQLRDNATPSLPSELRDEWATNPFLRGHIRQVARSASEYAGEELVTGREIFAALRRWKNNFQ